MKILRDMHDAEEVIQDVFVQIWTKARDFNPALGTAIHWTLAITRNRCIDRLRSRQRRHMLAEKMTEEMAGVSLSSIRKSAQFLSSPEQAAVHEAVKGLPDDQRTAIEMAFFSGLSHGDIAESLGEPLGTVKARIRRGMLKLRDELRRYL